MNTTVYFLNGEHKDYPADKTRVSETEVKVHRENLIITIPMSAILRVEEHITKTDPNELGGVRRGG